MCGDDSHRLGTGILKHAACTGNGSGGIDEIVDEHAVLTFDIAHDSVGDRLVRTGDVTRLVDECERTTAKTLRPLLRNTNAARIRRDDGNIVKLVGETVANVVDQHRHSDKVVDRTVEEALGLRRMQVDTHDAVGTCGLQQVEHRYIVNRDGILVDAGTALAPGAVSRLDPCGKYLIFFSNKGRAAMADKFGASMVSALGDVCETTAYQQADLAALAAQQLNALAQKVTARLGLTLAAGADVRDYVAAQCTPQKGAAGLSGCCDRIFRALSEYCLQTDKPLTGTVTLTAAPEGLLFRLNDAAPAPLFDLLPAAYTGALDEIRAEISELVGLAPVKEYVFGLADNLQVQQRRAAAGMKTASLSMHMIFTGNPGTGKTTIARLVAKYLKAIGALKGGQLVEVGRGDLVGRYTGHTAPLTNSVIESALGGVLFIDEAYSLYRGEQDSFGLEAIDTLVKGMEDHRDELVVILAGYTREMETFLTANSGLASRFPNKIEFPDYTADELLQITHVLAKNKGYTLSEACEEPLRNYYARRQADDARTAGNGRLARNTLEKAIFHQSRRLVAEPAAALDVLLPSDLELDE